tara:strand:- start:47 stop:1255 length:1209 start_codon:yes stop_codon:yes gene_type:complete
MNYKQTLDYLFTRLPLYQKKGPASYKADIGNILKASSILGNPHDKFKSIHVAGTNGKGSVSHMLSSILQEAGYKVGLYTSPHLKDFRERIKINGQMISKEDVVTFVSNNKNQFEQIDLSFFEFTVALSFKYFEKEKVDIAVIEVGLGGRLDSTNIINPELSIITNISLDHTNILGDTLEKIAIEKGGIIKKNTPVIIGRYQSEIEHIFNDISKKKETKISYSLNNNYELDLKGDYQKENCRTAVTSITEMQKKGWKVSEKNIKDGLLNTIENTKFEGRWQVLNKQPLVICDTAHNEDGLKKVILQIDQTFHHSLHIVFGIVDDKNLENILKLLPRDAKYYFCKPNIPRGLDEKYLQKIASDKKIKGTAYSSVNNALNAAKDNAQKNDLIFIGGSTFTVAEVV